jgi:CRP-like cAMP-binding protein
MPVKMPDVEGLLGRSEFFRGISPRSIRSLAAICIPKTVPRKSILFLEGEKGHSMYMLAEGTAQLYKTTPEGREIVIKTIQPGEIFGEVVLFEEDCYPVSAVTLSSCLLLRLPKLQVHCLLTAEAFRHDFLAMLMRKQRYLTDRILTLSSEDVEQRFYGFLQEQYGRRERYEVPLSKKDIASAIGTIPETFSRLILRLKKSDGLRWEGRTLTLPKGFWQRREAP